MSFYKVETYSFPIANETQPHRYIHLTATGSLGRLLLGPELNNTTLTNTTACMPM